MIAHQKPLRDVALFSHACMQVFVVLVDHFPRACRPCCGCPSPRSLARLVRRRFVVAVAAVAVVYGAPAVNVVGAAAAAASCALCPFRSSSWSLPHGVFLMEDDVALSLCELACMKVVVVVAVLFQRAWLVRCTESALPAAPPPRLTPMESLFSPVSPKSKKGHFETLPVNLSGPCCVPLGKASFYPNVTSII